MLANLELSIEELSLEKIELWSCFESFCVVNKEASFNRVWIFYNVAIIALAKKEVVKKAIHSNSTFSLDAEISVA